MRTILECFTAELNARAVTLSSLDTALSTLEKDYGVVVVVVHWADKESEYYMLPQLDLWHEDTDCKLGAIQLFPNGVWRNDAEIVEGL